jgi:hypothetical protein
MPQVMPSQVVKTIDQLFPHASQDQRSIVLDSSQKTKLRGIIDLYEHVPDQLLVLSSEDYADLVFALSTITQYLAYWTSHGDVGSLPVVSGGFDSITVVRRLLAKCPDEHPPPATTDLSFISPDDLRQSIRADIGAAQRALDNNEWKAATVLAGSAIEALLHWRLSQLPATDLAAAIPAAGLSSPPHSNLDQWNLNQFILVSRAASIIEEDTKTSALLAKDYRNLIHPGRAARLGIRCDRGTAHSALGALYQTIRDLEP